MTSPRVAVLLAVFLASPAAAAPDAPGAYDKAYDVVRLKARAAYLKPSPIDEAVTAADLKTLAPEPGAAEPADRKKKNADLVEALQAVKTLQGAPDQAALAPAVKSRLMGVVYQRLALSSAEQAQATAKYLPGVSSQAPFSAAPPESVLQAAREREQQGRKRATAVMNGSGALRDTRTSDANMSVQPSQPNMSVQPSAGVNQSLNAADFRPRVKTEQAQEVPAAGAPGGEERKKGLWSHVVDAANAPLPGLSGWKKDYQAFAVSRMAKSDALDHEGSALLEKGGFLNTLKAGALSVEGFGNRLVALDKTAVTAVAIVATAVTIAVVAAPAFATAGVIMGTVKVGVLAFTAYNAVTGTAALVGDPSYGHAVALGVNFVGAGYAGKIADKAGKATHAITKVLIKNAPEEVAAAGALAATPLMAKIAGAEVATVIKIAEKSTHIAVEGAHEATKLAFEHSIAHEPPTQMAAVLGPFGSGMPTAAITSPH